MTWVVELDMLGVVTTNRTYLEIRGQEDDHCLLYLRTPAATLTFSPKLIERLRAPGSTDEQIAEQQQASLVAESAQGLKGFCPMAVSDLVGMLTR